MEALKVSEPKKRGRKPKEKKEVVKKNDEKKDNENLKKTKKHTYPMLMIQNSAKNDLIFCQAIDAKSSNYGFLSMDSVKKLLDKGKLVKCICLPKHFMRDGATSNYIYLENL